MSSRNEEFATGHGAQEGVTEGMNDDEARQLTTGTRVSVKGQGMWRPVVTHVMDTDQGLLVRVADHRGNSGTYHPAALSRAPRPHEAE